jgi:hypothetical protein
MIKIVEGFPESVVGFIATGRVTRQDYTEVLIPAVEAALRERERIRCYYQLGPDFAGFDAAALWEDAKVGVGHLLRWERVAVVTDTEWIRVAVNALRFLLPGEVRVFATGQTAEARAWIASA